MKILSKGGALMLEKGMVAPGFTLRDKDDNEISLSQFCGKKIVLYREGKDQKKKIQLPPAGK